MKQNINVSNTDTNITAPANETLRWVYILAVMGGLIGAILINKYIVDSKKNVVNAALLIENDINNSDSFTSNILNSIILDKRVNR